MEEINQAIMWSKWESGDQRWSSCCEERLIQMISWVGDWPQQADSAKFNLTMVSLIMAKTMANMFNGHQPLNPQTSSPHLPFYLTTKESETFYFLEKYFYTMNVKGKIYILETSSVFWSVGAVYIGISGLPHLSLVVSFKIDQEEHWFYSRELQCIQWNVYLSWPYPMLW